MHAGDVVTNNRQETLTLLLIEYVERLQKLMFGTLHHTQAGFPLILKRPARERHTQTVRLEVRT